MPESDQALCGRLAEWMGWKWEQDLECYANYLVSPDKLSPCRKAGRNPDWPDRYYGPAYDTGVAALELLDWLAVKGWGADQKSHGKCAIVYLSKIEENVLGMEISARAEGPPSVALPNAIALAAEAVMKAEEDRT